jgi:cell division protein FtsA
MTKDPEDLITVLDCGSQKTVVLVAEIEDGVLRYRGVGIEPSAGMRKGLIADLTKAGHAVNRAALAAEHSAQTEIGTAVVGIGGTQMQGLNLRGGVSFGARLKEITRDDVRDAVEQARDIAKRPDREVMHVLPQEFILDEQAGIHDPVGMTGSQLEVTLHLLTCSTGNAQSVVTCANKAGLEVLFTVYEGLAAAEAVVSADERELGVCVVDIGASTTELAVLFEGAVVHTAVLPIGGDHFTNDLAVALHVTVEEAEALKREYGNCVVTEVPTLAELELPGDAGLAGIPQPARIVRQRFLAEVLEPRAREFFAMLRDNLRDGGVFEALGAGCVLTGGGANMAGMLDTAESILRVPARVGSPVPLSRMPPELARPEYAVAVGMLLYAHRMQTRRKSEENGLKSKLRGMFTPSYWKKSF